ncbi:unnamed protein product [Hydatigera taeniaeformis]|uniref:DNA 3'-5' helicase n=1 Tax=Hydatigena taeniaeformis TaxID=6205 RepID=A0A3P7GEE1_HYDTA|nr:unnamed protein product [Hydatigera taeniaeformis]
MNTLGHTCLELTSDSPHYEIEEIMQHGVIIATPEKIDSLLRHQEGLKDLLSRVKLLMVDEIHTIADQSRGACLEATVMRFLPFRPRVIAATATCQNISDAKNTAEFLAREIILRPSIRQDLLNNISGSLLKECLSKGVGFHHAGVSPTDRRLVEEAFLEGCIPILDYLNVEVMLGRIKNLEDGIKWISDTYLAIRIPKNPIFYGLQIPQAGTSMILERLCLDALDKLKSIGALKISNEDRMIVPYRRLILIAGKLMCEHFLSASTVESIFRLTGSETLIDLIHYVAGCAELHEISIRNQEKSQLNLINKATGIQRLRYPTKGRITTPQLKVVTLLQAELNDFVVLEPGLQQESNKALKVFARCATGLRNLLWGTTSYGSWDAAPTVADIPPTAVNTGFACMAHVIELVKVVNYRAWADAPLASLRQLPDVSKGCANQLAGAGVVSLKDIERLGPRRLEQVRILNRKPPFGDKVYESALGIPKYELAAEQVTTAAPECVEFEFTVRLIRSSKFDQIALIVGDDKNCIIFKTVLSTTMIESSGKWSQRIMIHYTSGAKLLFTSLISFNFLGIDLNINFPIPWSEFCTEGMDQGLNTTFGNINQILPMTISPYIPNSPSSVQLKVDCKRKTPKICRSKQTKSSKPLFATPKRVCGNLKQANIHTFFKAAKLHSEQVPKGKSANLLTEISPTPKAVSLPSTPALNASIAGTSHTHIPHESSFAGDPPSLPQPSSIQTPSEVGQKGLKWNQNAVDCVSPETDRMVEEELCSFLDSVEASEEPSDFMHYRQLNYTISPIFPVDMDESYNYNVSLNTIAIKSPNGAANDVQHDHSTPSFKTPKEMQLLTSLDDVSRSESVCCDTGYVSSQQQSTSNKPQNSANLMETTSVKANMGVKAMFAVQEADKERCLKVQEMEVLNAEPHSSRLLDFQLLREGWDQLATFIYCYRILEKFADFLNNLVASLKHWADFFSGL